MNIAFAKRQLNALEKMSALILSLPKLLSTGSIVKLLAACFAFIQLTGAVLLDTPTCPSGEELDMSKFVMTWSDEFNAGNFDKTRWSGSWCWGDNGISTNEGGFWHRSQVSYNDGHMTINCSYREDGPAGPGYYGYGMDTRPGSDGPEKIGFEQLYGYFEIRCILPKGNGLNPAFWFICEGMFNTDPDGGLTDGGITGAEIDVFETKYNSGDRTLHRNSIYHTVHVDDYKEYHRSENQGSFYAKNPYEEFNTYGFEWNRDEYIFYINGVETARTDFGGVCQVPLYPIISLGMAKNLSYNKDLPAEFVVDYFRAYQYKQ